MVSFGIKDLRYAEIACNGLDGSDVVLFGIHVSIDESVRAGAARLRARYHLS